MKFHDHWDLKGKHAILSPSKASSWLKYETDDQLDRFYDSSKAAEIGTELHKDAEFYISKRRKLAPRKNTFTMYVNDCISYKMTPEVPLVHSDVCFGTADAIAYRNNSLFIFDLKTGSGPVHIEQLMTYAALFCLEYKSEIDFKKLVIELRFYQNDEIQVYTPQIEEIKEIMKDICSKSSYLLRKEAGM